MKTTSLCTLFTLVATAALAVGQTAAPAAKLQPGAAVKPDALAAAEWIQGTAPAAWEPGKVYMLECWATWCGPCVAMIPHVNQLHQEYAAKGLRVCGMNVWEEGRDPSAKPEAVKEKAAKFVKGKGEGMSYPIAFVPRGGAFEEQWLKAAGVRGIPHAFVVKDGKLLFNTHPAQITAEVVAGLLAGGEEESKAVETILAATRLREQTGNVMRDFQQALQAGDAAGMEKAIKALEEVDPQAPFLTQMRLDHAVAAGDWTRAEKMIAEVGKSPGAGQVLGSLAFRADREADKLPASLRKAIADGFAKSLGGDNDNPTARVVLANVYWKLDDKDSALAMAKAAAERPGRLPAEPFAKFLQALEAGQPTATSDVFAQLRGALQQQGEGKAKEVDAKLKQAAEKADKKPAE